MEKYCFNFVKNYWLFKERRPLVSTQRHNEKLVEEAMSRLKVADECEEYDKMAVNQTLLDKLDVALANMEERTNATLKENEILRSCVLSMGGKKAKTKLVYPSIGDRSYNNAFNPKDLELNAKQKAALLNKLENFVSSKAGLHPKDIRETLETVIDDVCDRQKLPQLVNKTRLRANGIPNDRKPIRTERKRRIKQNITEFERIMFENEESMHTICEQSLKNNAGYVNQRGASVNRTIQNTEGAGAGDKIVDMENEKRTMHKTGKSKYNTSGDVKPHVGNKKKNKRARRRQKLENSLKTPGPERTKSPEC